MTARSIRSGEIARFAWRDWLSLLGYIIAGGTAFAVLLACIVLVITMQGV